MLSWALTFFVLAIIAGVLLVILGADETDASGAEAAIAVTANGLRWSF